MQFGGLEYAYCQKPYFQVQATLAHELRNGMKESRQMRNIFQWRRGI